jgi:hypothetical protein
MRTVVSQAWLAGQDEEDPLRKDYSVGRVPVQFKEGPGPR